MAEPPPPEPGNTRNGADHQQFDEAADKFADYERRYLLQYIYFADIRGAAVIAALAAAVTFYFTQRHSRIAFLQLCGWHDWFEWGGLVSAVVALFVSGVALTPILSRSW
jgi:hypothetical protein